MAPRGIRNNNPLNIRKGNDWQGERKPQTDAEFEEFVDIEHGLRAAIIIVKNYMAKRIDTPTAIISRWAPSSENNTQAYINYVKQRTQINMTERFKFTNKARVCLLLWAMAQYECGVIVPYHKFETAYARVNS